MSSRPLPHKCQLPPWLSEDANGSSKAASERNKANTNWHRERRRMDEPWATVLLLLPPRASFTSVQNQLTFWDTNQSQDQRSLQSDEVVNSRKGHWAPFQTWLSHEPAVWAQASHLNPGPAFPSVNWGKTSSSRSRVTVYSSPSPHWWRHTPALAPSRTAKFQEQGMGMSSEMKIPGGKKLSLATGKLSPSMPTWGETTTWNQPRGRAHSWRFQWERHTQAILQR